MEKMAVMKRPLAWAGVIAPTLFVTIFTLEGWLRPGYAPLSMFVSALSLGSRGWIQIANFVVFGLLLLVFTRAVAAEFQSGKAARDGVVLLSIIAICYLLSGPFVMDPAGTPLGETTLHGTLHGILGATVFSLMPVTCFVFLRRFREDPRWQSLAGGTLALGTLIAAAVILLTVATKLPDPRHLFTAWLGLIQRAAIVPFMIWLFIFARGMLRRRETDSRPR
jgi:hypothetical protein